MDLSSYLDCGDNVVSEDARPSDAFYSSPRLETMQQQGMNLQVADHDL